MEKSIAANFSIQVKYAQLAQVIEPASCGTSAWASLYKLLRKLKAIS